MLHVSVVRACVPARSGSQTVLDFTPTADFPSLQYFDVVEKNSQADLAGLRTGDFLLQVSAIINPSSSSLLTLNHSVLRITVLLSPVLRIATASRHSSAFHRRILLVHVINWYTFTIHHFFTIYFWLTTHSSTNNIVIIKL